MTQNKAIKERQKQKRKPSLKDDIYFKAFFSKRENKASLIDFLEGLLKIKIEDIEIKEEVSLEKLKPEEKGGRLDLQATLNDGIIVNIEMQYENEYNIEKRSTIYAAKTISRYFMKNEKYKEAKQIIMVNILNYQLFGFEEYVSKTVTVLEKHRDYKINTLVDTYYIELPKFRKSIVDMNDKLNQWLAYIDNEDEGRVEMAKKKNEVIKKSEPLWDYLTGDAEIERLEELRFKWACDRASAEDYHREKGLKEGREKGIAEGRKEGRKEGELKKEKEIAKNMLKKDMDIKLIVELTGLTEEEIKELK